MLEAQRAHTEAVERETGQIIPCLFHRRGRQIRDFGAAWATACKNAGVAGRIPHDFRRSAVRNLTRAGVVETVAQKMTGHLTRSVFDRYNITSEDDLTTAAAKLDAATVAKPVSVSRPADLATARRRKRAS